MKNTPPQPPPPGGNKPDAPTRVGLREVIQMECQEHNSSILEIYNDSEQGQVFIQHGKIIHAVINPLKGEQALAKLLDLPGGLFELAPFEPPEEHTITAPWASLLDRALRDRAAVTKPTAGATAHGATAGEKGGSASRVAEMCICSPTGGILYEAQCTDSAGRAAWLQSVAQHAGQLGKILPLGQFDRMDFSFGRTRIVSRFRADSLVYMRIVQVTGNE